MNFPTWALQTRSYLGWVVSFELSVGGGGGRCRGFVLVQNPGNKLLNVHHSVAGQTLEHIHVDLKDKCRCFCSYSWQSESGRVLYDVQLMCAIFIDWFLDELIQTSEIKQGHLLIWILTSRPRCSQRASSSACPAHPVHGIASSPHASRSLSSRQADREATDPRGVLGSSGFQRCIWPAHEVEGWSGHTKHSQSQFFPREIRRNVPSASYSSVFASWAFQRCERQKHRG